MDNTALDIFIAGDFLADHRTSEDFISEDLREYIAAFDLRVCNLEGPFTESSCKPILKAGPAIAQGNGLTSAVKQGIFNVFTLANNHIMDYGIGGLNSTLKILENNNIDFFGAAANYEEVYAPLVKDINSVSVAFIGAGEAQFGCAKSPEDTAGYAWILNRRISALIRSLRQQVDFIIIMPHAGLEMAFLPLPEWRETYQSFIDDGADIVIGNHPHIIQPKELYKGKPIYYSLGNFYFPFSETDPEWYRSMALALKLEKGDESTKLSVKEVFLNFSDKTVRFDEEKVQKDKFLRACTILDDDALYLAKVNRLCTDAWNTYYRSYYTHKRLLFHQYLKKIKFNLKESFLSRSEVMLYHNIRIETHRYVAERALKKIHNLI